MVFEDSGESLNDLSEKYLEAFDNLNEVSFPSLDYHSTLEKLHKLEAEKSSGFVVAEVFELLARKYSHMPGPYKLLINAMGDAIIKEEKLEYLKKFMRIKAKYEDLQELSDEKLLDN